MRGNCAKVVFVIFLVCAIITQCIYTVNYTKGLYHANADAVSGASPTTYVVPYFVGSFVQARVRFESIVGTDLSYAKATLTKWK